ncbi:AAA family ATPase [Megamonas hypermegale]|uniref:AAA family ATPase n=1 Tax=Megamonas hypermegale TaxID=158847 RepID=UPI0026EC64BE|nr:AAA family ATPase [Megamonas hypermegale]
MVILIAGASHTGKTVLAQKMLEKYKYPYLSIDHLKMGLIRSGQTDLTPEDDNELTVYLWNIVQEIIKTVIENEQNLIVEGGYIPENWRKDFAEVYLKKIRYYYLIMSEKYVDKNFEQIKKYANIVERRISDDYCTKELLIEENKYNLEMCRRNNYDYILIDEKYNIDEMI